jgi:vacuolar-type H+-ATPase subunit E/Vma4
MKKLELQQIIKEEIQKILETSESEIIDALRKKYKSDLKGLNDDEDYKNLSHQAKLKVKDSIESEIIDALREKYKFDLKGVNDNEDYQNLSNKSKLKVKDYIRFDIEMER